MKSLILVVLLVACAIIYSGIPSKQENKMAAPGSVYWIGANGNTYVKTGDIPVQDYGQLPQGSSIAGSTQIDDPNPGGGGGGGTSAAPGGPPAVDQATLASYDQGIGQTNSALNRLGITQGAGNTSIDNSYNSAIAQLLQGYNQSKQTNDQNVLQSKQDYVGGKNTIGANAGSSLNSLLRLLGSRGAGGGSAATISAPGAVARQATLQRTDLGNTFGKNQQALDQNWGQYNLDYNTNVAGAGTQRTNAKNKLESDIATNRATLLQNLAQLQGQRAQAAGGNAVASAQPYLDQANSALNFAASYAPAPIAVNATPYTAPSLDKYTTNPNAAPTYQGQTAGNDYFSPYLQALLGKKQQGAFA